MKPRTGNARIVHQRRMNAAESWVMKQNADQSPMNGDGASPSAAEFEMRREPIVDLFLQVSWI
jgi:hypothetical protein